MRASTLLLLVMVSLIVLAPLIANKDPMRTDPAAQFEPPGLAHALGTDLLGRDVLSRTLYGGRQTLLMTALATILSIALGLPLGLASGADYGLLSQVALIAINALLALPSLMIAFVAITLLGRGLGSLVIAVGLSQIGPFAYTTRSALQAVRSSGYIESAANLGATQSHILVEHILPNIQATLLAYAGVVFSYALLNGAALGFLGLGGELTVPAWGIMLAEGRAAFRTAPWISAAPGLMISLTVWAVNDLVDNLRRISHD